MKISLGRAKTVIFFFFDNIKFDKRKVAETLSNAH